MSRTPEEIIQMLQQDLDKTRIKYRKSSDFGSDDNQVPYLEGYDIIDTANRIFDFEWWFETETPRVERWGQAVTVWNSQTRKKDPVLDNDGNPVTKPVGIVYVTGKASVKIGGEWYVHGDLGRSVFYGDTPEALDTALAGAVTDCMKRCFRQLGAQFGNTLYDKEYRQEELNGSEDGNQHRNNPPAGQQRPQRQAPNGQQRPAAPRNGAPAPKPAAAAATSPATPQAGAAAKGAPAAPKADVEAAKAVVVPKGLPMENKTLGSLAASAQLFERDVLHWFTGEWPRRSDEAIFQPKDVDEEALAKAAKIVWGTIESK